MSARIQFARLGTVAALTIAFGQAAAEGPVATLAQVQGVTLVAQGSEYVTASPGMPLQIGDRLMAMEGASATVKFHNGCLYQMKDNEILTVGTGASCSAGKLVSRQVGPYLAAAAGGGTATAGWIAGGVAVAAVIAGVASSNNNNNDNRRTLSP